MNFMACPRDPLKVAFQLLAALLCTGKTAICHAHLGTGVAPCTIAMSMSMSAGSPCSWRQKLLWRLSRNLFLCGFSFCWAPEQKNDCFVRSQKKLQRFVFALVKNEFDRWNTVPKKKSSSNIVPLVAVALYDSDGRPQRGPISIWKWKKVRAPSAVDVSGGWPCTLCSRWFEFLAIFDFLHMV